MTQITSERFKEIRAKLGLSGSKMARLMRINERTVFAYESGRSLVPGCTGVFLDTIMGEPAAARYALKMAGLQSKKLPLPPR